jgi:hypothetical protein
MAIRFIEANPEPKRVVRTRSVTAPLDSRIANYRDNYRDSDPNYRDMPKRGRPPTGNAMTAAERQRLCRERKRLSSSGSSSSP